jgi:hypothetical protein
LLIGRIYNRKRFPTARPGHTQGCGGVAKV